MNQGKNPVRLAVFRKTKSGKYIKQNIKVGIVHNLDRPIGNGKTGLGINPDTLNPIHVGITRPHYGQYKEHFILIKEEIFPEKPRSQSRRLAFIISPRKSLDWILYSSEYTLLTTAKFSQLVELLPGQSLSGIGCCKPSITDSDVLWSEEEMKLTKERLKYVPYKRNRRIGKQNTTN